MGEPAKNLKLAADGDLVLPAKLLRAAGITGDVEVAARVEGGAIMVEAAVSSAERESDSSIDQRVRRAQALFRKYVKSDFSSDEFLATRERD